MWFFGSRRFRGEGLRVLFCTMGYPPDGSGGSQHQAALLAQALLRAGHAVDVVCPRRGGQKSGAVDGVPLTRLMGYERRVGNYRLYHWRLLLHVLFALPRYDIVHVHTADHQLRLICLAARLWRKPVYAKAAAGGDGADLQRLKRRGDASAVLRCVTLQAISDEIAEEWLAAGVSPERIVAYRTASILSATGRQRLRKSDRRVSRSVCRPRGSSFSTWGDSTLTRVSIYCLRPGTEPPYRCDAACGRGPGRRRVCDWSNAVSVHSDTALDGGHGSVLYRRRCVCPSVAS